MIMIEHEVWFSHKEKRYELTEGKFTWTEKKEIWDWDKCTIGLARNLENKLIAVVRSKTNKNSRYMGNKPVELRFMLGFEVNKVSEPATELYIARDNHPDQKKREGPKERYVIQLNDNHWIWEWGNGGENIGYSYISKLYKQITQEISNKSIKSDNIFDVILENRENRIIPVIYQPAVDSIDNFLREVHCAHSEKPDGNHEIEVTLIFNNEVLRKHAYGGFLNKIYERFRHLYHGRILDVETFKILLKKDITKNKFKFEKIYSDEFQLEEDSIHGDKPPAPERDIKYYFIDYKYPVVFINTSNHAMAEHDTNHHLWKWEYVPLVDNAPIKLGNKNRKAIERGCKPILKFW